MVDLKLSCGNDGFWKYEILEFVLPPQIWTSKKNPSDEILRFYTLTQKLYALKNYQRNPIIFSLTIYRPKCTCYTLPVQHYVDQRVYVLPYLYNNMWTKVHVKVLVQHVLLYMYNNKQTKVYICYSLLVQQYVDQIILLSLYLYNNMETKLYLYHFTCTRICRLKCICNTLPLQKYVDQIVLLSLYLYNNM